MPGSTVSISNQAASRRRLLEKNNQTDGSDFAAAVALGESDAGKITSGDKDAAISRDGRRSTAQVPIRKSNQTRRPPKPRWLTVLSILAKNAALIIFILGLIQVVRWTVMNSGRQTEGFAVISGDFDEKFAEVEKFVKTTVKAMQVQVIAIDKKIEDSVGSVRKELHETIEKKDDEMELKLKVLDARNDAVEKFMDEFGSKSFVSKEEFAEFLEEFKRTKSDGHGAVSLNELKAFAMEIVEKEIAKHSADGLAMVDYALASAGGRVVKHSEPYKSNVIDRIMNRLSPDAEKMLMPSFGEPANCFPLKGESGFVVIRLRTAIVPEAVTLEHVAKSVAYDRSSAPKQCRVSGWMQEPDSKDLETDDKMFLLAEFPYDLEKSNAQTFNVLESAASMVINTIRLDFASNHGSSSHTCIYRLRVHGFEPTSVPEL